MRLKIGDLAIVVNSRFPSNNGRLVVIQDVWPPRVSAPFQIRPVDGQPLIVDGVPASSVSIFSAGRYLRPLPPLAPVERDALAEVV
ncbi:MAG: hypothetical protein LC121_17715 [Anaerolineae bacterium]|nr:hypothetical protein [Anaerolineae bacterium]